MLNINDNLSGVYLIKNIKNDKYYVGSSYKIRNRINWHRSSLIRGSHPNNKLQNSFNKYGLDAFEFIPLINCPKEYNYKLEQWFKDKSKYNCSLNIAINCEKPMFGRKLSEEHKKLISEKNKGFKWNNFQKNNLKLILKEKKDTDINFERKRLENFKTTDFSGSKNGNSKLTENERLDIINLLNLKVRNKDIVKKYPNITSKLITEVKSNRTWKSLQYLIKR